jgi:hypothetical protein
MITKITQANKKGSMHDKYTLPTFGKNSYE